MSGRSVSVEYVVMVADFFCVCSDFFFLGVSLLDSRSRYAVFPISRLDFLSSRETYNGPSAAGCFSHGITSSDSFQVPSSAPQLRYLHGPIYAYAATKSSLWGAEVARQHRLHECFSKCLV